MPQNSVDKFENLPLNELDSPVKSRKGVGGEVKK
jgi:hypothetical protein